MVLAIHTVRPPAPVVLRVEPKHYDPQLSALISRCAAQPQMRCEGQTRVPAADGKEYLFGGITDTNIADYLSAKREVSLVFHDARMERHERLAIAIAGFVLDGMVMELVNKLKQEQELHSVVIGSKAERDLALLWGRRSAIYGEALRSLELRLNELGHISTREANDAFQCFASSAGKLVFLAWRTFNQISHPQGANVAASYARAASDTIAKGGRVTDKEGYLAALRKFPLAKAQARSALMMFGYYSHGWLEEQ